MDENVEASGTVDSSDPEDPDPEDPEVLTREGYMPMFEAVL